MSRRPTNIEEIKEAVRRIARKYKVERVFLFGSYARGDVREDSDIDLRIDKGELKGLFQLAGLQSELEAELNMNIDLLTTGSLDEEFLDRIKEEEIIIYEQ